MTRAEFIAEHRHDLAGLLVHGLIQGKDYGELKMFLRLMYAHIDDALGRAFDEAVKVIQAEPPKAIPSNGQTPRRSNS